MIIFQLKHLFLIMLILAITIFFNFIYHVYKGAWFFTTVKVFHSGCGNLNFC